MTNQTLAMSVLFHGEAVRFNRGKVRGDDYDFKYLRSSNNEIIPYVSGQSFKKHWREALQSQPSPIIRPTKADGSPKNQAYTAGNPLAFIDDDLFGYMIAGADAVENTAEPTATEVSEGEVSAESSVDEQLFKVDDLRNDGRDLLKLLRKDGALSAHLLGYFTSEQQAELNTLRVESALEDTAQQMLADGLNLAIEDPLLYSKERFKKRSTKKQDTSLQSENRLEIVKTNRELLGEEIKATLLRDKPRPTTRRTAPIRLHALVAFSGIRLAKDFQTFSRDVALTGNDSVLNPSTVGIYSGWLKTRILIEGHRIGKFYVGKNLDVITEELSGQATKTEIDPYSRKREEVLFVQLELADRQNRLQDAVRALANVNNARGPASGALHDGSLRPQGFIAAMMSCSDSPFDDVWVGTDNNPRLSIGRLRAVLNDYKDLISGTHIYVGLPLDRDDLDVALVRAKDGVEEVKDALTEQVEAEIKRAGFVPVVGSPRQTLLRLADEVTLSD